MVDGIFHDAHEVYGRNSESQPWEWAGTLPTKDDAFRYGGTLIGFRYLLVEVRPV